MRKLFALIFLLLLPKLALAQDIPDSGTQINFQWVTVAGVVMQGHMHVCPAGYAMGGAHFSKNVFTCRSVMAYVGSFRPSVVIGNTPGGTGSIYVDGFPPQPPSQGNPDGVQAMHVCPPYSVMIGADITNNAFACQVLPTSAFVAIDKHSPSGEQGPMPGGGTMHICNLPNTRWVMSGAHDGANIFSCDLLK